MIEITNYTLNTAHEFEEASSLTDYIEAHEGDEIGVSHCSIIAIYSLEDAEQFLSYSDDERARLQVISNVHGYAYYTDLDTALSEFEELHYILIEGETTTYGCARALEYEPYLEDDLYMMLGCTREAYEQLGNYIDTDAIAHVLNTEYILVHNSSNTYIIL